MTLLPLDPVFDSRDLETGEQGNRRAKNPSSARVWDAGRVTYDPVRRGSPRVPVLRDEWREPLRAQRDPLAEAAGRMRSNREARNHWPRQTWLGRFISTYGWRAYALPVLMVVTVVVLYQTVTGTGAPSTTPVSEEPVQGPPTIGSSATGIIGAPPRGMTEFDAGLPTGLLPDGGPFTEAGAKTWHIVPGATPQFGEGTVKTFTYTVEVEDGIDATTFGGADAFARMVDLTLANPKSWTHNPQFGFVRLDQTGSNEPDFRISLTSPMTVREGCGYEIELEASCYNPAYGADRESRVFINEARWARGAMPFQGDVGSYRQYVINHEVGHAIGYQRHEPCDKNGGLAPVMMQQTFSTSDDDNARFDPDWVNPDGNACQFNPWPYPIA